MKTKRYLLVSALAVVIISVFYYSNFAIMPVQRVAETNKAADSSTQDDTGENDKTLQPFTADTTNSTDQQTEKSTSTQEGSSINNAVDNQTANEQAKETDKSVSAPDVKSQSVNSTEPASRGTYRDPDVYLMKGDENSKVTKLQENLKALGYFNAKPTGFYGDITFTSVKKLQSQHKLKQDGIVHNSTLTLINKLVKEQAAKAPVSKPKSSVSKPVKTTNVSGGSSKVSDYLMPWFGGVENFFGRGETATVYDINSGMSFKIKRTYGTNHADCETLTSEDTRIMKQIYGGQWSWVRRPIIVTVNGRKIAASMAGMPHAGVDSEPANINVSWRSEDYGAGINLDTVKGNDMDGHFDIHFLNSRTHVTNSVEPDHQNAVREAAAWAEKNY